MKQLTPILQGVFIAFIDDLDFMEVQGATFFAELDPDLVVTGSTLLNHLVVLQYVLLVLLLK